MSNQSALMWRTSEFAYASSVSKFPEIDVRIESANPSAAVTGRAEAAASPTHRRVGWDARAAQTYSDHG
jgi:hypothetical protein